MRVSLHTFEVPVNSYKTCKVPYVIYFSPLSSSPCLAITCLTRPKNPGTVIVPPWLESDKLLTGTVVLMCVSLHTYEVPVNSYKTCKVPYVIYFSPLSSSPCLAITCLTRPKNPGTVIVPPWLESDKLLTGTVVLMCVSLHTYEVPVNSYKTCKVL
jgi:hypothetical protein